MNLNQLKIFTAELGITHLKATQLWVSSICPLARYKHTNGRDTHASFFISITDEAESLWHCFGCSPSPQTLFYLIQELWILSGNYSHKASKMLLNQEYFPSKEKEVVSNLWDNPPQQVISVPSYIVNSFPLIFKCNTHQARRAISYLREDRGITESVIKRFGVRFCDVNNAILFPYTDSVGEVLCLKARVPFTKKMFSLTPDLLGHPWLSFPSIQVSGAFFGMHLVRWEDPVTVVEGEIDMLRLASLGCENVLSAGTCTLSGRQIDSLHGVNYRIGLDSDLAGKKGSTKAVNMLRGRGVLVSTLDWSLVDCKDPGDLKDEQQLNVVLNKMAIAAW